MKTNDKLSTSYCDSIVARVQRSRFPVSACFFEKKECKPWDLHFSAKGEAAGKILRATFGTLAASLLPCDLAELLVLVHADLVFAVALRGQPREFLELIVEIADVVVADACADLGDGEIR